MWKLLASPTALLFHGELLDHFSCMIALFLCVRARHFCLKSCETNPTLLQRVIPQCIRPFCYLCETKKCLVMLWRLDLYHIYLYNIVHVSELVAWDLFCLKLEPELIMLSPGCFHLISELELLYLGLSLEFANAIPFLESL